MKYKSNVSIMREYVLGTSVVHFDDLVKELKERGLLERAEQLFDKFSKEIENEFTSKD